MSKRRVTWIPVPVVMMPAVSATDRGLYRAESPALPTEGSPQAVSPASLVVPSEWVSYQIVSGTTPQVLVAPFSLQTIEGGERDYYAQGTWGTQGQPLRAEWSQPFRTIYITNPQGNLIHGVLTEDHSMFLGYWSPSGPSGQRMPWIAASRSLVTRRSVEPLTRQLSGVSFPVPSTWQLYQLSDTGRPLTTGVVQITDARPGGMFKIDLSGTLQTGGRSVPISGQWSESSHSINLLTSDQFFSGHMPTTDSQLIGGTWGDGRNVWVAQRIG